MTTSTELFTAATELGRNAREADDIADDLDRNARPLDGVLKPVIDLHTADTWSSTAAENSRRTLAWQHLPAVESVRGEVAELVRLLRAMAEAYRSDQRLVRSRAETVAAQERQAGIDGADAGPPSPPGAVGPTRGGGGSTVLAPF